MYKISEATKDKLLDDLRKGFILESMRGKTLYKNKDGEWFVI